MEPLFVVKMTRKESGAQGYHSVWSSKSAADRQAKLRNQHHPDYEYTVHEVTDYKSYSDWWNKNQASFVDSAGSMPVHS